MTHLNWDPLGVIDLSHSFVFGFGWAFRLFQFVYAGIRINVKCGSLFWCIIFIPSLLHMWTACNDINGILWIRQLCFISLSVLPFCMLYITHFSLSWMVSFYPACNCLGIFDWLPLFLVVFLPWMFTSLSWLEDMLLTFWELQFVFIWYNGLWLVLLFAGHFSVVFFIPFIGRGLVCYF